MSTSDNTEPTIVMSENPRPAMSTSDSTELKVVMSENPTPAMSTSANTQPTMVLSGNPSHRCPQCDHPHNLLLRWKRSMMDEINRLGFYDPLLPWKRSTRYEINRLGSYIHKLEVDGKERDLALETIDNLRALADIVTEIATLDKLEAEGAETAAKLATIDKLKAEIAIQLDIIDKLRSIEELNLNIGKARVNNRRADKAAKSAANAKLKAENAGRAGKEANALRAHEGTTGWKKNLLVFLDRYSDRLLLVLLLVLLFFFAFILGNLTAMGGLTVVE